MNAVDAANKAEIDMIYAILVNKFGKLYPDIWKVGVNLSLASITANTQFNLTSCQRPWLMRW